MVDQFGEAGDGDTPKGALLLRDGYGDGQCRSGDAGASAYFRQGEYLVELRPDGSTVVLDKLHPFDGGISIAS